VGCTGGAEKDVRCLACCCASTAANIAGFRTSAFACPDPVDFRAFLTADLYNQENVFYLSGANKKVEQPRNARLFGPHTHLDA
jgi:hypothetical protein